MVDIMLFGIGQFAEVAKAYFEWEGTHRIVGFTVDAGYKTVDTKDNLPVVAWEDIEKSFPASQVQLFCPLSYRDVNGVRREKFLNGKQRGYRFATFIHPKSHYYDTLLGENCFILEGNVIQPYSQIGDNCILWSGNHIGHHTIIEDHCFIASHVVVSGSVRIGARCFLGVNSTIRDNISIGEACVIGAGASVLRDLPSGSVVTAPKSKLAKLKSHQLKQI